MSWSLSDIRIVRPDIHTTLLLVLLSLVVLTSYFVHTSHHLTPPPIHVHDHDHVHSLEHGHHEQSLQSKYKSPQLMHHSKHTHAHARTLFKTGLIHHHTRVAICFSGSLRTFATTVYWYKMKLIRPLLAISGVEIHIFAHVWKDMEHLREGAIDPPTQPSSMSGLVHTIFAAHDMLNHVRVITSNTYDEIKKNPEYQRLYGITTGKANDKDKSDPTRLLLQHWSTRAANRLKQDWENQRGWNFTWVYRCRYDMLIRKLVPPFFIPSSSHPVAPALSGGNNHSDAFSSLLSEPEYMSFGSETLIQQQQKLLSSIQHINATTNHDIWQQHWVRGQHAWMLSPQYMYVPSCEWWGGIGDVFALSSSHLMDIYCERLDPIAIETYLSRVSPRWHPESYLMWWLTSYHNISVLPYPLCFSIIRQADDAHYTDTDHPNGVCAYGSTNHKGRGCCTRHCRQDDSHCYPWDWEPSGNANSIAHPLLYPFAPHTYDISNVTSVLSECLSLHVRNPSHCHPQHITDLVERTIEIRRLTHARCPPLVLPPPHNTQTGSRQRQGQGEGEGSIPPE